MIIEVTIGIEPRGIETLTTTEKIYMNIRVV